MLYRESNKDVITVAWRTFSITLYEVLKTVTRLHCAGKKHQHKPKPDIFIIKIARLFISLKELFAKNLNQSLKKQNYSSVSVLCKISSSMKTFFLIE